MSNQSRWVSVFIHCGIEILTLSPAKPHQFGYVILERLHLVGQKNKGL